MLSTIRKVVAAKDWVCEACKGAIPTGTRHLAHKFHNGAASWVVREHLACPAPMARSMPTGGAAGLFPRLLLPLPLATLGSPPVALLAALGVGVFGYFAARRAMRA